MFKILDIFASTNCFALGLRDEHTYPIYGVYLSFKLKSDRTITQRLFKSLWFPKFRSARHIVACACWCARVCLCGRESVINRRQMVYHSLYLYTKSPYLPYLNYSGIIYMHTFADQRYPLFNTGSFFNGKLD